MNTFDITVEIKEYNYDELDPIKQKLVTYARKATYRSYAPYSNVARLYSNTRLSPKRKSR